MKTWAKHSILWAIIIGGLLLPLLSINGFQISSLEYLLVVLISVLLGVLVGTVTIFHLLNGAYILFILVLFSAAYLSSPTLWENYSWLPYVIATVIGLFTYTAVTLPNETLIIIAAGALMYIVSSAALAPSLVVTTMKNNAYAKRVNKKIFPILHVMMDEHIGIAGIPNEVMSKSERDTFIKSYLDRGFLVFTHAYTADFLTQRSIARLFNPTLEDPMQALRLNTQKSTWNWDLMQADALQIIAKTHSLNLFAIDRLNLKPSLQGIKANVSLQNHNLNYIGDISSRSTLSLIDRMLIMSSLGLRWLYADFKSPLVIIIRHLYPFFNPYYINASHPTKLDYLNYSLLSSSKIAGSNWYTFIHVLMPHSPFIYNEDCTLRPFAKWSSANSSDGISREISHAFDRYSLHLQQAKCATKIFLQGLDRFRSRTDFDAMTVIVHGDHGSRIKLDNLSMSLTKNSNPQLKLDAYSTFLAIRLPKSQQGQVIDIPVRVDDVFKQLVQNNFASLDITTLPQRENPFE